HIAAEQSAFRHCVRLIRTELRSHIQRRHVKAFFLEHLSRSLPVRCLPVQAERDRRQILHPALSARKSTRLNSSHVSMSYAVRRAVAPGISPLSLHDALPLSI